MRRIFSSSRRVTSSSVIARTKSFVNGFMPAYTSRLMASSVAAFSMRL